MTTKNNLWFKIGDKVEILDIPTFLTHKFTNGDICEIESIRGDKSMYDYGIFSLIDGSTWSITEARIGQTNNY